MTSRNLFSASVNRYSSKNLCPALKTSRASSAGISARGRTQTRACAQDAGSSARPTDTANISFRIQFRFKYMQKLLTPKPSSQAKADLGDPRLKRLDIGNQ